MLNSSRSLLQVSFNRVLSRSLIISFLSTVGILTGMIPTLSAQTQRWEWDNQAYAQSLTGERAANFARSILETELLREATRQSLSGVDVSKVECDASGSVRNLRNVPPQITRFCKEFQAILQQNDLSLAEFEQMRTSYNSNQPQYPQVTVFFQQMCQNNRYSKLKFCQ